MRRWTSCLPLLAGLLPLTACMEQEFHHAADDTPGADTATGESDDDELDTQDTGEDTGTGQGQHHEDGDPDERPDTQTSPKLRTVAPRASTSRSSWVTSWPRRTACQAWAVPRIPPPMMVTRMGVETTGRERRHRNGAMWAGGTPGEQLV